MPKIPTITKNLLIINVLMFIATLVLRQVTGTDLTSLLGLHFVLADDFHFYQLFTYLFMHGGWTHIILNMFMLWMFGAVVESRWGAKRYLFYYIFCGVGAGLCQELVQYVQFLNQGLTNYEMVNIGTSVIPVSQYLNYWTTVGASGAIYGLLLAFGMMFPNERMFIIPIPVPIKAKWVIVGSIAVEFFSGIGTNSDGVAHMRTWAEWCLAYCSSSTGADKPVEPTMATEGHACLATCSKDGRRTKTNATQTNITQRETPTGTTTPTSEPHRKRLTAYSTK